MELDPDQDILGIIDATPTFMPGGELPVAEGDKIVTVINVLLKHFHHAFAVQDWHPPGHISFARRWGVAPFEMVETHYGKQTVYPEHAVQGTENANLHPEIDQRPIEAIIRKGFDSEVDSYSGFFENNGTPTGLDGWLRQRGFKRLFLVGLALDKCVAWTAEDGVRLGYEVIIVEDGCRGLGLPVDERSGYTSTDEAKDHLKRTGVKFIHSRDIVRSASDE